MVIMFCARLFQVIEVQLWSKLLTTCNKLDGTIRLVTRLFQYCYNIVCCQLCDNQVTTEVSYTKGEQLDSDFVKLSINMFGNCYNPY